MNQVVAAIRGVRVPAVLPHVHAWAAAERGRFVPWVPVFMGAGAIAYFSRTAEPGGAMGAGLVGLAATLCALARHGWVLRAFSLALLAATVGFAAAQLATWRALPGEALPRTAIVLTGTVLGVETLPETRRVTIADASWEGHAPLNRHVRVRLRAGDATPLAAGDTLRIRALLRPPAAPAYPGGWDLQREAYFSGLAGSGSALGPAERLAIAAPSGAARGLQALRDTIAGRILAALPGPEGGIAATLLTGMASAIPPADRAAFRDSGLAHLLAIAGLHIGIVMGLVMLGTRAALGLSERAALFWPCKQIAAMTALAAGAGYLLLTGAHVPILRSFAMAALVTLGVALGRRALSLRGLALAATVLLLFAPQQVLGVSFQMSFAAVLALIAGYQAMQPALARLHGGGWGRHALRHAAALTLTSVLAGLASAPYGAYHFGQVQAYFVVSNLVAVPLTATVVMPAGLAALALMPFGLERWALAPMGWGIDGLVWIARSVAALPAATLAAPHMAAWGLAVLSLGLAWLCLWRTRLRLAGIAAILLGLCSGWFSPAATLLVSGDGRLIALAGTYVQSRPGYSPFVLEAWEQYWGRTLTRPFPEDGTPGPVQCVTDGCRIEAGGTQVLLARASRPQDCSGIALVVSAEPAGAVCPGVPAIDRFAVWRDGTFAVWLHAGRAEIMSDRMWRGARPWVPPPPAPARARTTLPMATSETLED